MAESFFFYDLETSGFNPRVDRVMQFAGQRTDLNLKPIGNPHNYLIKISDDVLPSPDAILVTGITPQKTIEEGLTEIEFIKIFDQEINLAETIFVGFNSIRFDDEFMRFLFWRNFYDPYEWQWKDGRSRWDILDLSRMTRALRPDGIKWPYSSDGKPTNKLEMITSLNGLEHVDAHDALSDVRATIGVAKLIKNKQPKIFDYLLKIRRKNEVVRFIESNNIFVYSTGKYSSDFEKTSVVCTLSKHPDNKGYLVYDLRHDPDQFINLTPEELAEKWKWKRDSDDLRLPIKSLQANRCPAIAPLAVVDDAAKDRLAIDLDEVKSNYKKLVQSEDFIQKIIKAIEILNIDREQSELIIDVAGAETMLYSGFVGDDDRSRLKDVRSSSPDELSKLAERFSDERLRALAPIFKARNYPKSLSSDELARWEEYRKNKLFDGGDKSLFSKFNNRITELLNNESSKFSDNDRYVLDELRLYAESILPDF